MKILLWIDIVIHQEFIQMELVIIPEWDIETKKFQISYCVRPSSTILSIF